MNKRDEKSRVEGGDGGKPFFDCLKSGPFAWVCAMLDQWIADYPVGERENMRRRVKCQGRIVFEGAFFELYIFRVLRELGCNVKVNPVVRGKTPDFLAEDKDGRRVFVEATARQSCLSVGGFGVEVEGRMSRQIKHKVGKYPDLDAAYVIAVNNRDWPDSDEVRNVLLGPKGIFQGKDHSDVSAVLAYAQLNPLTMRERTPRLHLNPNARFPLAGPLREIPSKNPAEILGLPVS